MIIGDKIIRWLKQSRLPAFIFAVDIALFALEPRNWVPHRFMVAGLELSSWRNMVIVLLGFPYVLQQGWRRFPNAIFWGYSVMLATSLVLATRLPQLTVFQSIKSYIFLLLGPVFLYEIKFRTEHTDRYLTMLGLLPVMSVSAGIILTLAQIYPLFRIEAATGAWRLNGASDPGTLGLMAYAGILALLVLVRQKPLYIYMVGVDLFLEVLSGTRTSTAATLLVLAVYFFGVWRGEGSLALRQRALPVALALVIGLVIYVPNYPLRFQVTTAEELLVQSLTSSPAGDLRGQKALPFINTSGRLRVWTMFWGLARGNLLFGRGIGSATLGDLFQAKVLRVPHNEYLRLIVEGGGVGLLVGVAAYFLQFRELVRVTVQPQRNMIVLVACLFAASAIVENVITGQAFALIFWTFLGCVRERNIADAR